MLLHINFCPKITFLLLFVILTANCFAQPNVTDSKGNKQGIWAKTNAQGVKLYEGQFVDNKPIGTWKRYHDNGKLKADLNYLGDTCKAKIFNENADLIASGIYINERKEGEWSNFNNGILLAKINYKNDVQDGLTVKYHDLKPIEESNWKSGKKHGWTISYNALGTKVSETMYENDYQDGLTTYFHPNGKIRLKGMYKAGLRDGEWTSFSAQGIKIESQLYVKGKSLSEADNELKENKRMQLLLKQKGKFTEPDPDL